MSLEYIRSGGYIYPMKKRVLFPCTHNSCRSQMAERLVNHYLTGEHHE